VRSSWCPACSCGQWRRATCKKTSNSLRADPYAYTRNPLYLGSLLLGAGFAIAARSWWIVGLMLLMFAVIYVPVIGGEERYLRQTFPGYDDYARHVPRLWPRFTAYGSQQRRVFFRALLEAPRISGEPRLPGGVGHPCRSS
jgi:protein-S-isoprenylcysteine O-methyltransferase Ste14